MIGFDCQDPASLFEVVVENLRLEEAMRIPDRHDQPAEGGVEDVENTLQKQSKSKAGKKPAQQTGNDQKGGNQAPREEE